MSADAVQPESPVQAVRPPSPSTVAYLFADRFVPSEKPGKTGMSAFGTGAVVVTSELAGGLVAIALWQLRQMGAVSLEAYSAKRLGFINTSGVRVRLTGTADVSGGVEKTVLNFLQRSKKAGERGETAWDLANIICIEGRDPRMTVIGMAIDEAIALGYLHREKTEAGVIGRLAGKPSSKLHANAEQVATLAPAAERLAIAWRDFRQGEEAEMVKLLRSTTYDGIEARVRRNRDDD